MPIPDAPLPPWLRRFQLTYWYQAVLLPVVMGFGSALVLNGCLANGVQNITTVCVWTAVNATIAAMLTAIFSGHSPGSASFKPDGEPNKVVADVVKVQQAAASIPTPDMKMAVRSVEVVAAQQASIVMALVSVAEPFRTFIRIALAAIVLLLCIWFILILLQMAGVHVAMPFRM